MCLKSLAMEIFMYSTFRHSKARSETARLHPDLHYLFHAKMRGKRTRGWTASRQLELYTFNTNMPYLHFLNEIFETSQLENWSQFPSLMPFAMSTGNTSECKSSTRKVARIKKCHLWVQPNWCAYWLPPCVDRFARIFVCVLVSNGSDYPLIGLSRDFFQFFTTVVPGLSSTVLRMIISFAFHRIFKECSKNAEYYFTDHCYSLAFQFYL